jgi:hypothetical protein
MTERMGIRKFLKRKFNPLSELQKVSFSKTKLELIEAAGYQCIGQRHLHIDEYINSYELGPLMTHSFNEISEWCNDQFTNKHWVYLWGIWMFTKPEDATMFKLSWTI